MIARRSSARTLSGRTFGRRLATVGACAWVAALGLACNQMERGGQAGQAEGESAEGSPKAAAGDLAGAPGETPERAPASRPDPSPDSSATPSAPAHGFGEKIAWRGLEDGLREAAATGKGMMLVVHASWCSKCRELKPTFFDEGLVSASRDLVMVNVDQDEEHRSLMYAPDGTYIPRVLFIGPDGEVVSELKNGQRSRFQYFYTPVDDLVGMMKQAAARYERS